MRFIFLFLIALSVTSCAGWLEFVEYNGQGRIVKSYRLKGEIVGYSLPFPNVKNPSGFQTEVIY